MPDLTPLINILQEFDGITIVKSNDNWVNFTCRSESSLAKISSQMHNMQKSCKLRILPDEDNFKYVVYQILFGKETTVDELLAKLKALGKKSDDGLGVPDLSLTTIKQMSKELKTRENLCFAIVWIEGSGKDNITIEGSGNPTQLVGLLARGTHMAINWADDNIKFTKSEPE